MSGDMTTAIVPKSDQINADDFIAGPRTITIAGVLVQPGQEQPVSIQFEGSEKVYRPCKSMARVLVSAWGADSKAYVGRALTLYRDPAVKWGGMQVGGIRISHMSDIGSTMTLVLAESRATRKQFTVKPLKEALAKKPDTPAPEDRSVDQQRQTIEPKTTVPDMNGPTLKVENTKGVVTECGPDKWLTTLESWFTKQPFDTSASLYKTNYAHIESARLNGFEEIAAKATAIWRRRQDENAGDVAPA